MKKMNLKTFQENCSKTANWTTDEKLNFAHFVLGIVDETDEITDEIINGNYEKLGYELMDRMWYVCNTANMFDIRLEYVQKGGIPLPKSIAKIAEMCKKYIAYDKPFDKILLAEHLNSITYYTRSICENFDIDHEQYYQKLIDKLSVRYPNLIFSKEAATAKKDGL